MSDQREPGSTPDPHRQDTAARERIRHSLDESLLVEAAAGTGKTTVLVDRLVSVLARGRATVDRIVAVTFTRKAAGELELRLRQELDRERQRTDDPVRQQNLEAALARLEEANIGTIHSFCAEVLRRRPVEAGLDPAFVEMDPEQADALYARVFRTWAERRLDALPPGLSRALQRLAVQSSFGDESPLERLRQAGRELVDWRDFATPWRTDEDPDQPFDRAAALADLVRRIRRVARQAAAGAANDPLRRSLEPVLGLAAWLGSSAGSVEGVDRRRHLDELEAQLVGLLRDLRRQLYKKGRGRRYARGLERQAMLDERRDLVAALEDFDRRASAQLAASLRQELWQVLEDYEEAKRASGRVDFLDLLVRCRDLLRDHAEVRRDLQSAFSHVFVDELQDTDPLQAEILLLLAADDPGQSDWRRTRPLPGKLFLVGDPKQSIYRFRRADVLLYQAIREQLGEAGVGLVHLRRSFRSVRPLQRAINRAFGHQMTEDRRAGQPAYVPLDGDRPPAEDQPALVALPVPAPFGWSRISGKAIDESLPPAVCAFVDWLLRRSGWTVVDPDDHGRRVPIAPRHVCLLFRRYLSWGRDVTEPYLRGLEARGLPHLLVGGRSFHRREEVETLRTALRAVEWPDDSLAVYGTLRGDLFGFHDDLLLRYLERASGPDRSHGPAGLDPLAALARARRAALVDDEGGEAEGGEDADGHSGDGVDQVDREERGTDVDGSRLDLSEPDLVEVEAALVFLGQLHRERNQVPIAETIHRLLEHTRAQAAFALRPAGNQVLSNVQRVVDLARAFETGDGLSFRGFVDYLDRIASQPGRAPAPAIEEGADGVRLMTTHTAKGLEFPVVVLVDLGCKLTATEPSLFLDAERGLCARRLLGCSPWELLEHRDLELERERAEGVRLAYVAATRARDLLVVPGLGTGPWPDGWTSPLDHALYPPTADFADASPAPGCPPFGTETVLEGPRSGDPRDQQSSLRPGLYRLGSEPGDDDDGTAAETAGETAGETTASVVWWDPSTLDLAERGPGGVRSQQMLEPDPEGRAEADGLDRYQDWLDRRDAAVRAGLRPSQEGLAVTELEQDPPPPADGGALEIDYAATSDRPEPGPSGRRFGTLVHTVLRDVPLAAGAKSGAEPGPGDGSGDESQEPRDRTPRASIEGLVRLHARALGATEEEQAAAVDAIDAALAHPVSRRAARAERLLREVPFQLRLEGDFLVEGSIDLAFFDDGEWTVIDFKTDADPGPRLERYRRQLAWYVHALGQLTGEPARGLLLSVRGRSTTD